MQITEKISYLRDQQVTQFVLQALMNSDNIQYCMHVMENKTLYVWDVL